MAKAGIEWSDRSGAAANARRLLPKFVSDYFGDVRRFLSVHRSPKELHRMRLAAKRLRYTLELFRPCYGPGLEERLDALKGLQDALGDVNDAVATRTLLGHSVDRQARHFLKERAAEKAHEFRKHWKETFDAPLREAWWTAYLERNAHEPRLPSRNGARSKLKPAITPRPR